MLALRVNMINSEVAVLLTNPGRFILSASAGTTNDIGTESSQMSTHTLTHTLIKSCSHSSYCLRVHIYPQKTALHPQIEQSHVHNRTGVVMMWKIFHISLSQRSFVPLLRAEIGEQECQAARYHFRSMHNRPY